MCVNACSVDSSDGKVLSQDRITKSLITPPPHNRHHHIHPGSKILCPPPMLLLLHAPTAFMYLLTHITHRALHVLLYP